MRGVGVLARLRHDVLGLALGRQALDQRVEPAERAPPRREPVKQNALLQRDDTADVRTDTRVNSLRMKKTRGVFSVAAAAGAANLVLSSRRTQ